MARSADEEEADDVVEPRGSNDVWRSLDWAAGRAKIYLDVETGSLRRITRSSVRPPDRRPGPFVEYLRKEGLR